jgi:hypothetical protein
MKGQSVIQFELVTEVSVNQNNAMLDVLYRTKQNPERLENRLQPYSHTAIHANSEMFICDSRTSNTPVIKLIDFLGTWYVCHATKMV